MFDPTIINFISKLKTEIIRIAEDYSSQLMEKEIKFNNEENLKDLINYIERQNSDWIFPEEFKIEFYSKKEKIEISKVIDILLAIIRLKKNTNLSSFQFRLIKSTLLEIKMFRNLFSHNDTIADELIQRFFENVYFLFKYMKLPEDNKNRFKDDDSFLSEITFHMQNSLRVNIKSSKSFRFEYSLIQEKLNLEREKPKIANYEEAVGNFLNFQDEINKIFSDSKVTQDIYFHNYDNLKFSKNENVKFFKERDEYINFAEKSYPNISVINRSNRFNEINALSFSNNSVTKSFTNESKRRNDTAEKDKYEKDITGSDLNTSNNVNSFTNNNTFRNSINNDSDL